MIGVGGFDITLVDQDTRCECGHTLADHDTDDANDEPCNECTCINFDQVL